MTKSNTYMDTDKLPIISNSIGKKMFLKTAVKCKLTNSFPTLNWWFKPLLILLAVAIGVGNKFAYFFLKGQADKFKTISLNVLLDPWVLGMILSVVICGVIYDHIVSRIKADPKSKSIEKLIEALDHDHQKENYDCFIDLLASKLSGNFFPRFVIIDDYCRLDFTTQKVIQRYLEEYSKNAIGSEIWIVFETEKDEKLSTWLLTKANRFTVERLKLYRQLLLEDFEKQELIKKLNLQTNSTDYITVKDLCHGNEKSVHLLGKFFEEYRMLNPKPEAGWGSIDFLFLLSLTSYPGKFFFSEKYLIKNLSDKTGLQSEILSQFLNGFQCQKKEIQTAIQLLKNEFNSPLILTFSHDRESFLVKVETSRIIDKYKKKLRLPDDGLGHSFWSLFWYYKIANQPDKPFLVRKLSYHLSKAKIMAVKSPTKRDEIISSLFEAFLFSIGSALKLCLFHQLYNLILDAYYMLEFEVLKKRISNRKRLYTHAWEAYVTTGDDRILNIILDIYNIRSLPETGAAHVVSNPLIELFLDTIPIHKKGRLALKQNLSNPSFSGPEAIESITGYAMARSAWYASTILKKIPSSIHPLKGSLLLQAVDMAKDTLCRLSEESIERITSASNDHPRIIDLLTLSLSQSCLSLSLESETDILDIPQKIEKIFDFADTIVILSMEVSTISYSKKHDKFKHNYDFLLDVVLKETCLTAIASILMVCKNEFGKLLLSKDIKKQEKIYDIIKSLNELYDFGLPIKWNKGGLPDTYIYTRIDSLLKLCSVVYHRFGLNLLRDLLELRRLQYNRACMKLSVEKYEEAKRAIESLSMIFDKQDYSGVLANFILANIVCEANDLKAHYINKACTTVVKGASGSNLKKVFSLIAIIENNRVGIDNSIFMEQIVNGIKAQEFFLTKVLDNIGNDYLDGFILRLLNTCEAVNHKELAEKVFNLINGHIERLPQGNQKTKLESTIELFQLTETLKTSQEEDVKKILISWEDRKEFWMYPSLLRRIIEQGFPVETFNQEIIKVLNHKAYEDNYTSYFHLSLTVSEEYIYSGKEHPVKEIALTYLKDGIEQWEATNSVETNLNTYLLLYNLEKGSGTREEENYLIECEKWQTIKIQRDHLRRLPRLSKDGQFFMIFSDYFESIRLWGVQIDIDWKEFNSKKRISPDRRNEQLMLWKNSGQEVPNALINNNISVKVSSEFMLIGYLLFNQPADADVNFNEDRKRFNMAAEKEIPDFVNYIVSLPNLPESIKNLIVNYRNRFKTPMEI